MSKYERAFPDMTLHQYYMAHAPITMEDARQYVVDCTLNYREGVAYTDLMLAMRTLRESYADAMCGSAPDEAGE